MYDSTEQARSGSPAVSDSVATARRVRMVEEQLRPRGIYQCQVLEAMRTVPREQFVPESFVDAAYDDCPLPIGYGQTISQPYTVALMCQALDLKGDEKVLEIGTGSGYAAAVLSHLASQVFSIERIPELARRAAQRLESYSNVTVRTANGTLGLPEEAPFHGIVVTAGADALPQAYLEQLADGGRIVIPLGAEPRLQSLVRLTLRKGKIVIEDLGGFAFVPLIGQYGWNEEEAKRFHTWYGF